MRQPLKPERINRQIYLLESISRAGAPDLGDVVGSGRGAGHGQSCSDRERAAVQCTAYLAGHFAAMDGSGDVIAILVNDGGLVGRLGKRDVVDDQPRDGRDSECEGCNPEYCSGHKTCRFVKFQLLQGRKDRCGDCSGQSVVGLLCFDVAEGCAVDQDDGIKDAGGVA
jgi:hypothetical protein